MNNFIGESVLITTDKWFMAPDGLMYRAVWGNLIQIHEAKNALGFIPNRAHANWFVEIGNMIIMGCQVLYVTRCSKPNTENVTDYVTDASKGFVPFERPTQIYIAE